MNDLKGHGHASCPDLENEDSSAMAASTMSSSDPATSATTTVARSPLAKASLTTLPFSSDQQSPPHVPVIPSPSGVDNINARMSKLALRAQASSLRKESSALSKLAYNSKLSSTSHDSATMMVPSSSASSVPLPDVSSTVPLTKLQQRIIQASLPATAPIDKHPPAGCDQSTKPASHSHLPDSLLFADHAVHPTTPSIFASVLVNRNPHARDIYDQ